MEVLRSPGYVHENWGIPPKTLTDWRYRGIGPAWFKVGRAVKYRDSDLAKWLAEQKRGG